MVAKLDMHVQCQLEIGSFKISMFFPEGKRENESLLNTIIASIFFAAEAFDDTPLFSQREILKKD